MQRDRWVGPGVVLMQHGNTVWIAMRARLWKCSTEQVRHATSLESRGAEIMNDPAVQQLIREA